MFIVVKSFPRKKVLTKIIIKKFLVENCLWLQNNFLEDRFLQNIFIKSHSLHGLWNPETQCRIHKGSAIIPILTQINPIPRIGTYPFKVHSNNVLPSTPKPP